MSPEEKELKKKKKSGAHIHESGYQWVRNIEKKMEMVKARALHVCGITRN